MLQPAERARAGSRGALALALGAALAAACGVQGSRAEREVAPVVLAVSPQGTPGPPGPPGDGSAARPFASLAEALRAAPAGALVRLDEGTYEGGLVLVRPVVLMGRGPSRTRIVPGRAAAEAPILTVRGTSAFELRGVSLEGGAVGLAIEGGSGHLLSDVSLRGQADTALLGSGGASISMRQSEVVDLAGGLAGHGILLTSGALQLRGCVLRRAGRRALELHGVLALIENAEVSGSAVSALQATDGSDVLVRGGVFSGNGGAALYAGGARLRLEGVRAQGNEYGVLAFRGANVAVEHSEFIGHRVAAIAFVSSTGSVRGTTIRRGGIDGGISALGTTGPLFVEDTRLIEPGRFGLHLTNADAVLRRVEIASASPDNQGELGDGIFAVESTVSIEDGSVHDNAGSGLVLTRARCTLRGSDLVGNGRAGLSLLDRSTALVVKSFFGRNGRGVQVSEHSELSLTGNAFDGNTLFSIDSGCGEGSVVREPGGGNRFTGAGHLRTCP